MAWPSGGAAVLLPVTHVPFCCCNVCVSCAQRKQTATARAIRETPLSPLLSVALVRSYLQHQVSTHAAHTCRTQAPAEGTAPQMRNERAFYPPGNNPSYLCLVLGGAVCLRRSHSWPAMHTHAHDRARVGTHTHTPTCTCTCILYLLVGTCGPCEPPPPPPQGYQRSLACLDAASVASVGRSAPRLGIGLPAGASVGCSGVGCSGVGGSGGVGSSGRFHGSSGRAVLGL